MGWRTLVGLQWCLFRAEVTCQDLWTNPAQRQKPQPEHLQGATNWAKQAFGASHTCLSRRRWFTLSITEIHRSLFTNALMGLLHSWDQGGGAFRTSGAVDCTHLVLIKPQWTWKASVRCITIFVSATKARGTLALTRCGLLKPCRTWQADVIRAHEDVIRVVRGYSFREESWGANLARRGIASLVGEIINRFIIESKARDARGGISWNPYLPTSFVVFQPLASCFFTAVMKLEVSQHAWVLVRAKWDGLVRPWMVKIPQQLLGN